jgi:hypothetical protein
MMIALGAGILAFAILPGTLSLTFRSLMGWNVSVWLYLVLTGVMMVRADHEKLRQVAVAQAGAAVTVLGIAIVAAVASLAPDWERVGPYLTGALDRFPSLHDTGVRTMVNGPEAFTPDNEFCLGETEVGGFFVAAARHAELFMERARREPEHRAIGA